METLSPFAFVTLVTLISGAGGTGLGGLIGALFKSESNRTISLLLAFAGGVMTAMVCFDLLAEAEEVYRSALTFGPKPPKLPPMVQARVTEAGVERF